MYPQRLNSELGPVCLGVKIGKLLTQFFERGSELGQSVLVHAVYYASSAMPLSLAIVCPLKPTRTAPQLALHVARRKQVRAECDDPTEDTNRREDWNPDHIADVLPYSARLMVEGPRRESHDVRGTTLLVHPSRARRRLPLSARTAIRASSALFASEPHRTLLVAARALEGLLRQHQLR